MEKVEKTKMQKLLSRVPNGGFGGRSPPQKRKIINYSTVETQINQKTKPRKAVLVGVMVSIAFFTLASATGVGSNPRYYLAFTLHFEPPT